MKIVLIEVAGMRWRKKLVPLALMAVVSCGLYSQAHWQLLS